MSASQRFWSRVEVGAPHHVAPLDRPQESIVYFAIPDHAQAIPGTGMSVGEWIAERMKRSRYDVK